MKSRASCVVLGLHLEKDQILLDFLFDDTLWSSFTLVLRNFESHYRRESIKRWSFSEAACGGFALSDDVCGDGRSSLAVRRLSQAARALEAPSTGSARPQAPARHRRLRERAPQSKDLQLLHLQSAVQKDVAA